MRGGRSSRIGRAVDAPQSDVHFSAMSTLAEIEAAIEQLPLEDFRALREWIAQREEGAAGCQLGAAVAEMVAEKDPARAKVMWKQIVAGFYGDAYA